MKTVLYCGHDGSPIVGGGGSPRVPSFVNATPAATIEHLSDDLTARAAQGKAYGHLDLRVLARRALKH